MRRSIAPVGLRAISLATILIGFSSLTQLPYGLESRAPIGPYLNHIMPPSGGTSPPVLSATGAFSNVSTLTPSIGVIPSPPTRQLERGSGIRTASGRDRTTLRFRVRACDNATAEQLHRRGAGQKRRDRRWAGGSLRAQLNRLCSGIGYGGNLVADHRPGSTTIFGKATLCRANKNDLRENNFAVAH
jgi:hypothetical protein